MKKPPLANLPPRDSNNDKRRLHPDPDAALVETVLAHASYRGISKHKANPRKFGLPPYNKARADETLCDLHANFQPQDMDRVGGLLARGISSGLIGEVMRQDVPTILWTIDNNGQIYEARITNTGQWDYHGYPVRVSEPIAEEVYKRFAEWARAQGDQADRVAAANCKALYGF